MRKNSRREFLGYARYTKMKTTPLRVTASAVIILIIAVFNGCGYSVIETSESAGFNGGFEIVKNGLPVNWDLYGPKIIKNGDVKISLDTEDAIEGKQSLKLLVHRARPGSLRGKPGLFKVLQPAKTNRSYKVSFWLKNQGCRIHLQIKNARKESGKEFFFGPSEAVKKDYAEHPSIKKYFDEKEMGTNTWRQFEYIYVVPETDGSIKFELNILQPGTLWIDDVRIEEVQTD